MSAIEAKVVTRATPMPPRWIESSRAADFAEYFSRARSTTSPPSRARDCSRTDCDTLLVNESMATSAATPSEIDDMYSRSRRRAVRLSRHAMASIRRKRLWPFMERRRRKRDD